MKTKLSLPIRLSALPAVAALTVVLLAALTLVEFSHSFLGSDPRDGLPGPGPLAPERPESSTNAEEVSWDAPEYTEEEALRLLDEAPSRPAVDRLWPHDLHRDRLYEVLLEEETPEAVRLSLLARFEAEDELRALDAAREILKSEGESTGPVLLAAYEIVSRHGEGADLDLFASRPGESHQLKTLREEYRATLRSRRR